MATVGTAFQMEIVADTVQVLDRNESLNANSHNDILRLRIRLGLLT